MKIGRVSFVDHTWLDCTKSGEVVFSKSSTKVMTLEDTPRELKRDGLVFEKPVMKPGPFERADFGSHERLAWPAGACAMEQEAMLAFWEARYAIWLEDKQVCVVDSTRGDLVRVAHPIELGKRTSAFVASGKVVFEGKDDAIWLALDEVLALLDRPSGAIELDIRELFPQRREKLELRAQVEYFYDGRASVESYDPRRWMRLPILDDMEEGIEVTLYDEFARDRFAEISIGGGPRQPLSLIPASRVVLTQIRVEPAIDPAGQIVKPSQTTRQADLDRVFGLLADENDDAARLVVVDLLEDAGEPYAPLFAKLLAGETGEGDRREALGTLATYFDDIEYRGNLPWAATLSLDAPDDADFADLVAADHRLGFFHTLRLGEGNFRVYSKLVSSPRAAGLRHADGSRAAILTALIAGGRKQLRRLSGVKFATREVIEALADATFDGVVEIETETQSHNVERLLDYITRDEKKFFAKAPRHLLLVEQNGHDTKLVAPVIAAWDRLPLVKLSMAGITIARDGTAQIHEEVADPIRAQVAARFRIA